MPEQAPDIAGFPGEGPSAADSNDSALQYVAIDILEAGGSSDQQRELLDPVEEALRDHYADVMREAIGRAFRSSTDDAARWAVSELVDRADFSAVPDRHREAVRRDVTQRLEEKEEQLANELHDVVHAARQQAVEQLEDRVLEWGAVV